MTVTAMTDPNTPTQVAYRELYRRDANGEPLPDGTGCVAAFAGADCVGALFFDYYAEPPVVVDLSVEEPFRRRGIATSLFEFARSRQSGLTHFQTLTDDGQRWIASLRGV